MRTVRKIAIGIVLIAIAFILSYWLFPGEVVAIHVEAQVPKSTQQIIREVFSEQPTAAIAIAMCESRLNPLVVNYDDAKLNGFVSRGIFQLSEINGKLENWQDPETNAKAAFELYKKSGWRPWWNCATRLGLL